MRCRPLILGALVLFVLACAGADDRPQMQLSWWDRAAEAKVGHYWIKTDLPADQANALARHLNIMYEEYSRRLASLPSRAPEHLNVLIFAEQQEYVDTLRTKFGVNAAGSGGMFFRSPNGSGLAFFTANLPPKRVEHVLQHEGFHQFAYSRFGDDLPIWLNEGLAEFFGESILVGSTLVIGQTNPRVIGVVKDAIEKGTTIPFRRMLTLTSQQWSENVKAGRAALQYHQAWSMVHFLVYADPQHDGKADYVDAFETYLKLLNRAFPPEEAFVRAFGTDDFDAFEARWKEYALAARPSAFVAAMERIEFLAEGALALSRRGIVPQSLAELRDSLRELKFTYAIDRHGVSAQLSSADDAMFEIPMDDLTNAQPAFEVTAPDLLKMSRRERRLEEQVKTPPSIGTVNLKPRGLAVRWIRDEKTGAVSYEILVK